MYSPHPARDREFALPKMGAASSASTLLRQYGNFLSQIGRDVHHEGRSVGCLDHGALCSIRASGVQSPPATAESPSRPRESPRRQHLAPSPQSVPVPGSCSTNRAMICLCACLPRRAWRRRVARRQAISPDPTPHDPLVCHWPRGQGRRHPPKAYRVTLSDPSGIVTPLDFPFRMRQQDSPGVSPTFRRCQQGATAAIIDPRIDTLRSTHTNTEEL